MHSQYLNYVNRFQYIPSKWPPDIGLAQLHSRCSQPGPINPDGIRCPCCGDQSKLKIKSWKARSIQQDFKQNGAAYAYFFLMKYYTIFIFLVVLINVIYPLYATYYTCTNPILNPSDTLCLKTGFLYYLQFDMMIQILSTGGHTSMVTMLQTLQLTTFVVLLIANLASIPFLSKMEKIEIEKNPPQLAGNILLLYNLQEQFIPKIKQYLTQDKSIKILRVIPLRQIKKYLNLYKKRNTTFYRLMALYVSCQDPLKYKKRNDKLKKLQKDLQKEKQKLTQYCGRVLVVFQTEKMALKVHKLYRFPQLSKWWNGFKVLFQKAGIIKEIKQLPLLSIRIPQAKAIKWQNLGQQLSKKMSIKITSLCSAIILLVLCYVLLYFPLKFTMEANIDYAKDAQLTIVQKIIPFLTSLVLVSLSILFRLYMTFLAEKRNPKDEMERAKFILITSVFFHFVFYLIVPTIFFTFSSGLNKSVKLYVISQQARTFLIIQLLFAFIDIIYQRWKSKKNLCLSDQREGFKFNQSMLHKIVQYPDYPLQIKLQTMFRIWSFALFYAFYLPYMIIYMFLAMIIIYWLQKHNIYKHYSLRKKISVGLLTQFLIIYVNLFIIYQCFIYCTNALSTWKIIAAVATTCLSIFINVTYWICFNPAEQKNNRLGETFLDDIDGAVYQSQYEDFLQTIQSAKLQKEVFDYLGSIPEQVSESDPQKKKSVIQMGQHYLQSESS